jgi:hypothetical protein
MLALASVIITLALEGNATHVRTVRPALPTNDRPLWHVERTCGCAQVLVGEVQIDRGLFEIAMAKH